MTKTAAIYGQLPKNLGRFDFPTDEMMFWLYCPVSLPGDTGFTLPKNLAKFAELLVIVREDCRERWEGSYVYLTAKTMFVSPGSPGNRLGWHADGFLTDDLNYIWSDRNPTLFYLPERPLAFTQDHKLALSEMETAASEDDWHVCQSNPCDLLRLDQTVLHAVNPRVMPGVRTFLKVSVSNEPYVLKGNSINHALNHPRPIEARQLERNHPQGMMV